MISAILTQRWSEAVAEPTVPRWRSLAQLAAVIADQMERDTENMMAAAYRGIYEEAYKRMSQLINKEEA